jgi:pimeloyl-ACP methyl ester carboxylesterase
MLLSHRDDPGAAPRVSRRYTFGLEEWRDVDAAAEWWPEQGARRPILVGESMGAAIMGQWLALSPNGGRPAGSRSTRRRCPSSGC